MKLKLANHGWQNLVAQVVCHLSIIVPRGPRQTDLPKFLSHCSPVKTLNSEIVAF